MKSISKNFLIYSIPLVKLNLQTQFFVLLTKRVVFLKNDFFTDEKSLGNISEKKFPNIILKEVHKL